MPTINQSGWTVNYYWSQDSGLQVYSCQYRGVQVIYNASVPFIYVNYAGGAFGPFTDSLRSLSGTVEVRQIKNGFDLAVRYDLYGEDYLYEHIWRFHDDGQFGSTLVIHGPGEEINGQHTYHVPFRFDLDLAGAGQDSFQVWRSFGWFGFWQAVPTEGGLPTPALGADLYDWRQSDASGKAAMIRARQADAGELWVLDYDSSQAWSAFGGALGAPPGAPGSVPTIYANGQSVQNADLVVWYLSHISARDRISACGPWFKLTGF